MRIGIAVHELNIRGGTHKQVQRLAEHLKARGETVRVYTKYFDPTRCYPGVDALDVRPVTAHPRAPPGPSAWRRTLAFVTSLRMARALARECDVVHIHDHGLTFAWFVARLLNRRLRFAWQINDLPGAFGVGTSAYGKQHGLRRRWIRFRERAASRYMAHRVDAITVNVSKNAARVRECMGVDARIFFPGVDLRNAALPAPRRAGEVLRLVSTGVFFPYRNYEAILRAQRMLEERFGLPSRLTIVGSTALAPQYAESVEALARDLGVACEVVGEVDEPTLARIYEQSDVFLFVNVDQSWGLAIFEAMDFGLPVVVSRSVGAIELLQAGVDCEVVDPLDPGALAAALHALRSDPALHRARAEAGFRATRRMTWELLYCEPVRLELRRLVESGSTAASVEPGSAGA
jgi:glycosyltransferase involved in cell wall biosynthesis